MHEVGCIHSTYLNEGHWQISFTSSYCNHVVICTFYNAFVYKKLHLQPVWQKFAHQEQVGLQLQHIKHICDANSIIYASRTTPTTMDLIMMVLVTLWSPKCTLCEEVTSLISSVILCKIMYFVAPNYWSICNHSLNAFYVALQMWMCHHLFHFWHSPSPSLLCNEIVHCGMICHSKIKHILTSCCKGGSSSLF